MKTFTTLSYLAGDSELLAADDWKLNGTNSVISVSKVKTNGDVRVRFLTKHGHYQMIEWMPSTTVVYGSEID